MRLGKPKDPDAPKLTHRIYEYKLEPSPMQDDRLWAVLRATRDLYNECLEERTRTFRETGEYLNYYSQKRLHPVPSHPDLDSRLIEAVLERLQKAFDAFFDYRKSLNAGRRPARKVGFPQPAKRWYSFDFSYRPDCIEIRGSGRHSVFNGGKCLGKIPVQIYREPGGIYKRVRCVRRPSGWYLQCTCAVETEALKPTGRAVGLDMGVGVLVTDTDGHAWKNPEYLAKSLADLRQAQKALSRCEKGSNRRSKAARRVAAIHERVEQQRKWLVHTISRYYVNHYDVIALEKLDIQKLVKEDGLTKKQRRRIMDAAWAMIRQATAYKGADAGRVVTERTAAMTTRLCSQCGRDAGTTFRQTTHHCPHCDCKIARRLNSARNVLVLATSEIPEDAKPEEVAKLYAALLSQQENGGQTAYTVDVA